MTDTNNQKLHRSYIDKMQVCEATLNPIALFSLMPVRGEGVHFRRNRLQIASVQNM